MATLSDQAEAFFGRQRARILDGGSAESTLSFAQNQLNSWQKGKKWQLKAPAVARMAGSLSLALDDQLRVATLGWLQLAAPAVHDAFINHFVPMAENAIHRWPVRSGLSKRFLTVTVRPDDGGNSVRMRFDSSAPYTYQIKWGKKTTTRGSSTVGAQVWKELLLDTHAEIAPKMAADITRGVS